ncbi:hypothetical protein HY230_02640, partial [Candidatus Acetothermia bacterium]|nr:hypothetical protein [Candidatus Acetothermia bacterium]
RVEVADSPSLELRGPLTLDAWVKLAAFSTLGHSPILAKWGVDHQGTAGYGLFINPKTGSAEFIVSTDGSTRVILSDPQPLPLNAFQHVAGVVSKGGLTLYVNGVRKGSVSLSRPVFQTHAPLIMGSYDPAFTDNTFPMAGSVDEAQVFNRALTDDEVRAIYSAGISGQCKATPLQNFALVIKKTGDIGSKITSSPTGIDCGPTCSARYPAGASVILTATPNKKNEIVTWGGSCAGTGPADPCTIVMNADKSVIVSFSAPCASVSAESNPATITYNSTKTKSAKKTISLSVTNRSGPPVTLTEIATLSRDSAFAILSISPKLPRTIPAGKTQAFIVKTERAAGLPPIKVTAPYFDLSLSCGLLPASILSLPIPLAFGEVRIEMHAGELRVQATGKGVTSVRLQIFDLSGRERMNRISAGNSLILSVAAGGRESLANGVYLYVVSVRGNHGILLRSLVRKIVIHS